MIQFVNQYFKDVKNNWRQELRTKKFRLTIAASLISILPFLFFLKPYLQYLEQRSVCDMEDIILNWLPVFDSSNLILILLFSSLALAMFYCMGNPWLLFQGLISIIILQYIRYIILFVTPLNKPAGSLPFQGPVLETMAFNGHSNLKDLFLSGHTATIFIFMLLTWNSPGLKFIFGLITILMAILLLLQHCQYTVGILVGVASAYLSFKWAYWIGLKIQLSQ